ncbi:MAG: monovalent cation/H(+) antiporter subunit G [Hyphomicrobiales bacterium]|nr:monovalent cation/H(+) antiporter subunit G [Hyphomicrobiales bacterium]
MDTLFDVLSWICIVLGSVTCLIGAIGLLRLPDVFARMHGAGMIDTMGMGMILLGLMFQAGPTLVTVKLIFIVVFIVFTSPTATHALARAALQGGVEPQVDGELEDSSSAGPGGDGAP